MLTGFFGLVDVVDSSTVQDERKCGVVRTVKTKKSMQERAKQHYHYDCSACGLCNNALHNPKLAPYGDCECDLMVWGEAPGEQEDIHGIPFYKEAKAGGFLHKCFGRLGLDLYRDAVVVNSVDCRPPRNRKPTNKELKCCWARKLKAIERYKPKVIILFGDTAIESFYSNDPDRHFVGKLSIASLRGKVVPDQKTGAWVCHSYHPSYITRGNYDFETIFMLDLKRFTRFLDKPRPRFGLNSINAVALKTDDEICSFLDELLVSGNPFAFDYETSSYRYHEGIHEIYMVSVSTNGRDSYVFTFDSDRVTEKWREVLQSDIPKIVQNAKHEIHAARYVFGTDTNNVTHDTMIMTHVLDGSKKVTGLKVQSYLMFGQYDYSSEIDGYLKAKPNTKNKFKEIMHNDKAYKYCAYDSAYCMRIAKRQNRYLLSDPATRRRYEFFHKGMLAFTDIEMNGIAIDIDKAKHLEKQWLGEMSELKDKLFSTPEALKFERVKGRRLRYKKMLSNADMKELLFGVLKFKSLKQTAKGGNSVDDEVLKKYADRCELISIELRLRKLSKLCGTYLGQFLRYQVDGMLYPTFHLHFARSYRSSSSEPNFQNIPKRDPESQRLIRSLIIPRHKDGELWGVDYSSMEVRILACQSRDGALIEYIVQGGDMHFDWAFNILEKYGITPKSVGKKKFKALRSIVKNTFVFPLFYGSWYKPIARSMYDTFSEELDGFDLPYRTWERHVKACVDSFWNQFGGVREWQDRKIEQYKRVGYVDDEVYGFRRYGYLSRNKIYNFPIQGPAFHCLLWSIIYLWEHGYLDRFKSLLCGEIHDDLFWDGIKAEFLRVRRLVEYVMTEKIREEHPWIIVPLAVEWNKGKNWYDMKEID